MSEADRTVLVQKPNGKIYTMLANSRMAHLAAGGKPGWKLVEPETPQDEPEEEK